MKESTLSKITASVETLEETHDLSPGLLLNEWLWLATNSTSQTGWTLTLSASITRAGIW
jgi:hypothetical protein